MLGPHSGMGQRGGQEPCQGDMMQAAAGRADAVGQPGSLLCWHLLGPLLRGGGRPGQGGALPCIPLPSGPKAPPEPLPGLMGRGYTGTGRGLGGDPNLCSAARSQTWVPGNPLGPHRCARPVATNGQHSDPLPLHIATPTQSVLLNAIVCPRGCNGGGGGVPGERRPLQNGVVVWTADPRMAGSLGSRLLLPSPIHTADSWAPLCPPAPPTPTHSHFSSPFPVQMTRTG